MASVYRNQRNYEIALNYYLKAYNAYIYILGLTHKYTQIVYKNLKGAYMAYNPEGNFEQWLEEKMKETE